MGKRMNLKGCCTYPLRNLRGPVEERKRMFNNFRRPTTFEAVEEKLGNRGKAKDSFSWRLLGRIDHVKSCGPAEKE